MSSSKLWNVFEHFSKVNCFQIQFTIGAELERFELLFVFALFIKHITGTLFSLDHNRANWKMSGIFYLC